MEHQDEKILKAQKALKENQKQKESKKRLEEEAQESIYDETVHIIGEPVHFERREIPELGVGIYMPECFFRFTEDIAKLLYPMGNTPSHIYGGQDINMQMLLNQTSHRVPDEGMKEFTQLAGRLIDVMGPKVRIVEKKVLEKETAGKDKFHIGVLSFVSRSIDIPVYNMQYYVSMHGSILMGSITFPSKYKKRMIPLAEEIVNSLELLPEEEHEGE